MEHTGEFNGKRGSVFSINLSRVKGVTKQAVGEARLIENFGLEQDAHSGPGLRQISLLAIENIKKQGECPKAKKKDLTFGPGDFAENITTAGLDLARLKVGDKLKLGESAVIALSKIGKECHKHCVIYYKLGDCIMPREGIFAMVLAGGKISVGDGIEVIESV